MTLADLISAFRARSSDTELPYLWSDAAITLYLNDAVQEAAVRARLIKDSTTVAVTSIAIAASGGLYKLHPSIFMIDRAKLASQNAPLTPTSVEQLDDEFPGWEVQNGTPVYLCEENGTVRLVPNSLSGDTLRLAVYRLPLDDMEAPDDEPEIHAKHHVRLLDWALRCAYLNQDSETFDETKAQKYEAMFERSFGIKPDANVARKQRDKRPSVVQMQW